MKNRQIRIALAALVFSIMVLSFGCGGPQNTNANQNSNVGNSATSAGAGAFADACAGNDVYAKRTAVQNAIQAKVDGDPAFKKQQTNRVFKFEVITEPGVSPQSLYVYLAGGIANIGSKFFFHDLMTSLKDLHKLKCVTKVIFVPSSALPFTALTPPPPGFEWFGCDTGTTACPGGICASDPPGTCPSIVIDTPTPNPASNSNANGNSNSNPNSGSNKP